MTAKMSEVFKNFMPVSPGMFTVSTPGFDLTTEEKSEMRKAAARAINEYDSDQEKIERLVEALQQAFDLRISNHSEWERVARAALSLAEGRGRAEAGVETAPAQAELPSARVEKPWYPDDRPWIEHDGCTPPISGQKSVEILFRYEREDRDYARSVELSGFWTWEWNVRLSPSDIVAYLPITGDAP